ncbi:PEP-CTERM sorting domain-containing protein [Verrucomicrobiaceae bacterium R5-34]|nr:PEP-CTERM sorting domain-containing protein [Verrucomicrobiaceae bacterium R5-34]
MKLTSTTLLLISSCAMVMPLSAAIVFSNNYEDNNVAPEVGSVTVGNGSITTVETDSGNQGTAMGTYVGLYDQNATSPVNFTLNLTTTAAITGGNSVSLDFDIAARRTSGSTKTFFVDALDSNGDIVMQLVLGDAGAYGNGGSDRQRPGYGTLSGGNSLLPGPGTPGSFWWGADSTTASFNPNLTSHFSLSIDSDGFDLTTTSQGGTVYSTTGLPTYDSTSSFTDIVAFEFTSAGNNAGIYLDNLVVETVPEPSSAALLGLGGLALILRRRK